MLIPRQFARLSRFASRDKGAYLPPLHSDQSSPQNCETKLPFPRWKFDYLVEAGRWVTMSLRVELDGNALPVERLSYQSEVEAPKRFSVQQWIKENEVYAERIDIPVYIYISIRWHLDLMGQKRN
ncbi:hypothetical protein G5I_12718 [Acromyrmex echinatior]|uniref:Uncharacterized protein n=1 Tax=Acromyrmex echinatior TaxID=103372 RepID=F4X327_ACREC|nr:hypothetical protein G5I_12718 [Acromyrmex echinatior]